jgi:CheY-like chemotaxis protein
MEKMGVVAASATKVLCCSSPHQQANVNTHVDLLMVLMTQEYAQRCLDVGMSDVLFKPFRREDLVATICKWTSPTNHQLD